MNHQYLQSILGSFYLFEILIAISQTVTLFHILSTDAYLNFCSLPCLDWPMKLSRSGHEVRKQLLGSTDPGPSSADHLHEADIAPTQGWTVAGSHRRICIAGRICQGWRRKMRNYAERCRIPLLDNWRGRRAPGLRRTAYKNETMGWDIRHFDRVARAAYFLVYI